MVRRFRYLVLGILLLPALFLGIAGAALGQEVFTFDITVKITNNFPSSSVKPLIRLVSDGHNLYDTKEDVVNHKVSIDFNAGPNRFYGVDVRGLSTALSDKTLGLTDIVIFRNGIRLPLGVSRFDIRGTESLEIYAVYGELARRTVRLKMTGSGYLQVLDVSNGLVFRIPEHFSTNMQKRARLDKRFKLRAMPASGYEFRSMLIDGNSLMNESVVTVAEDRDVIEIELNFASSSTLVGEETSIQYDITGSELAYLVMKGSDGSEVELKSSTSFKAKAGSEIEFKPVFLHDAKIESCKIEGQEFPLYYKQKEGKLVGDWSKYSVVYDKNPIVMSVTFVASTTRNISLSVDPPYDFGTIKMKHWAYDGATHASTATEYVLWNGGAAADKPSIELKDKIELKIPASDYVSSYSVMVDGNAYTGGELEVATVGSVCEIKVKYEPKKIQYGFTYPSDVLASFTFRSKFETKSVDFGKSLSAGSFIGIPGDTIFISARPELGNKIKGFTVNGTPVEVGAPYEIKSGDTILSIGCEVEGSGRRNMKVVFHPEKVGLIKDFYVDPDGNPASVKLFSSGVNTANRELVPVYESATIELDYQQSTIHEYGRVDSIVLSNNTKVDLNPNGPMYCVIPNGTEDIELNVYLGLDAVTVNCIVRVDGEAGGKVTIENRTSKAELQVEKEVANALVYARAGESLIIQPDASIDGYIKAVKVNGVVLEDPEKKGYRIEKVGVTLNIEVDYRTYREYPLNVSFQPEGVTASIQVIGGGQTQRVSHDSESKVITVKEDWSYSVTVEGLEAFKGKEGRVLCDGKELSNYTNFVAPLLADGETGKALLVEFDALPSVKKGRIRVEIEHEGGAVLGVVELHEGSNKVAVKESGTYEYEAKKVVKVNVVPHEGAKEGEYKVDGIKTAKREFYIDADKEVVISVKFVKDIGGGVTPGGGEQPGTDPGKEPGTGGEGNGGAETPVSEDGFVEVSVYPNPFDGGFEVSSLGGMESVSLYSLTGVCVYRAEVNGGSYHGLFDLGGLAEGVYLLEVVSGGERYYQRVVKR